MGDRRARRPPVRVAGVRRRPDIDRADQALLRRAAAFLRAYDDPADARAFAALLDILAGAVPDLDPLVRRQALESCRLLLGEPPTLSIARRPRSS